MIGSHPTGATDFILHQPPSYRQRRARRTFLVLADPEPLSCTAAHRLPLHPATLAVNIHLRPIVLTSSVP